MSTYGFIGLGLIGGSLAKSIRKAEPDAVLLATSRSRTTIDYALENGIIDRSITSEEITNSTTAPGGSPLYDCDILFLCAPVQTNLAWLPVLKEHLRPDCILTDVGSVKGIMARAAEQSGFAAQFIGGHPMAGAEKTGIEHATDYLLENAFYFLTPTENTDPDAVSRLHALVKKIHALPLLLSPREHDTVVAGVSHLPHLVAASLVNTVAALDSEEEIMKLVAAGGFRDITRIASSSPEVWEQICLSNPQAIVQALDVYIAQLHAARDQVKDGDGAALYQLFSDSKNYRDSIDDIHRGALRRQYLLYIDIYDETGGIAAITALLADRGINIKNIGIIHNREFEEGVLRLELYDEETRNAANSVLTAHNYLVRK